MAPSRISRTATANGVAIVTVAFAAGRPDCATGRPSRMVPAVIAMVARSIALHVAGHPWARADEIAADEYCATANAVGVYRMRLRDRLDPRSLRAAGAGRTHQA
jgi:hypothetical protein